MVKETRNLRCIAVLQVDNKEVWSFKVIGVDEEKKNYRLDISHSPFPNMYPVFHLCELEPYYKLPKTLVPAPAGNQKIIYILGSRKHQ